MLSPLAAATPALRGRRRRKSMFAVPDSSPFFKFVLTTTLCEALESPGPYGDNPRCARPGPAPSQASKFDAPANSVDVAGMGAVPLARVLRHCH